MRSFSNAIKTLYLLVLIIFISGVGFFWLDYIGMIDVGSYVKQYTEKPVSVLTSEGDEPSLVEREEFEKEKEKLTERIENLDSREAEIESLEKELNAEKEKLEEMKKGLAVEKKKLENEKKRYSGYTKNVKELAAKISNMPPEESVKIMVNWEDPLIIDVLREMDATAAAAGTTSITSFLITLMPKAKASRIMYLMTQL